MAANEDAYLEFKSDAKEAISKALKELKAEAPVILDKAPSGMGDIAFPCFPLAKQLKKSPDAIAKDIAAKMTPHGMIEKIEPKVRRHLVVAAPPRVHLAARPADPFGQGILDRHVDVLVVGMEGERPRLHLGEDLPKTCANRPSLPLRDDALPGQHPGVGDAPLDVLAV